MGRTFGGTYEEVWNGIDNARFRDAEPWPTTGPTMLFVGRHEPRKGLAVLISALAHLPADVRLWVASEGPETARLRQLTRDDPRIEWLGVISEREKMRRIRGADVLCAPSLHGESFGVILLEGMAAGTPVVASDLAGYRNVARPDRDALLTPPGDPAALAGAIDTALRGRAGHRGPGDQRRAAGGQLLAREPSQALPGPVRRSPAPVQAATVPGRSTGRRHP